MSNRRCIKCGKLMDEGQFYTSNNIEKYAPDGKLPECKKCCTMFIDNWDPDTYKPILEELDIPYVKSVWNQLLEKFLSRNDPKKITTTSVLGRYISVMKLKQWRWARWADSEKIAEEENSKLEAALKTAGYAGEDLAKEMERDFTPPRPVYIPPPDEEVPQNQDPFKPIETEQDKELATKLSEDEILGLKIKWGETYRLSELVRMEKLYAEMMASYDIQTAGHKDTLIFLCKTSLKLNQLLDEGNIDEAQKVSRMYDTLTKAGKFQAAQAKEEETNYVDSVGELIALAEEEGFIPRYYIEQPNDKIDETIMDMQRYTYNLVTQETSLGTMLESAMKQIEQDRENEKNIAVEDDDNTDDIFNYDEKVVTKKDFADFDEFEQKLAAEDAADEAGEF